jgi:acyl carrier protein
MHSNKFMDKAEILKNIKETMEDVFDRRPLSVSENTKAADIEEWDSLSHLEVIVAVENHFKVKFSTKEIHSWKNVGDICSAVENKLKRA